MKFNTAKNEVSHYGSIEVKRITLSANAKAFKIIFGQIYPDIIKAIVRELFANAWDSQKVANNLDTPIDVHIPSKWNPTFSIRDYGTGMTPQVVDEIYSKIFESTKDTSNEEAGMFGMGSKTPLGYTDAFAITSYIDGQYWSYSININEDGEPEIHLVGQGSTDEPNGVFVSLGVKDSDFDTFKNHAEHFIMTSGAAVNINKQRAMNIKKSILSGNRWILHDEGDQSFIRMGCILYKIDTNYISNIMKLNYTDERLFKSFFQNPFVIEFDIGEFDVTGSREDIVYNEVSCKKIFDAYSRIIKEIQDEYKTKIADSKNLSEALRKFLAYSTTGIIKQMPDAKYKNFDLNKIATYNFPRKLLGNIDICYNNLNHRSATPKVRKFVEQDRNFDICSTLNGWTYLIIDNQNVSATRTLTRINNLFKNVWNVSKKNFNILWVRPKGNSLNRLLAVLDINTTFIVNVDDIADVKIPRTRGQKYVETKCYRLAIDSEGELKTTNFKQDAQKDSYYIFVKGRSVKNMDSVIEYANILDINCYDVHVINIGNKNIIDDFNLKDLVAEAKKILELITYNDDTYNYHACLEARKNFEFGKYFKNGDMNLTAKWLGFPFEIQKVKTNFVKTSNKVVEKKFDEVYNSLIKSIKKKIEDYPIINYIDIYKFYNNTQNVLKILGEM